MNLMKVGQLTDPDALADAVIVEEHEEEATSPEVPKTAAQEAGGQLILTIEVCVRAQAFF